jgi:hypothetical protein
MDDLNELRKLAGLDYYANGADPDKKPTDWSRWTGSNPSATAMEKVKIMKEKKIEPGTPEWFRLWFSRGKMTGEHPVGKEYELKHQNQK